MRSLIIYTATSLDGYIAKPDGDIQWLENLPNPEKTDHGYTDFYARIDATLMGNKTYQKVMSMGKGIPYKDAANFVFSRNPDHQDTEDVRFVSKDPVAFVKDLKAAPGKDIWLIGGGQMNTLFLNAGLVDEMMIFVIPILLGAGIPLFSDGMKEIPLRLKESKSYSTQAVLLHYTAGK